MVFSSLEFIFVFLASVLAVYYLVPPKARNIVLLLFSLVFYGWGEPVYVFLMIVLSVLALLPQPALVFHSKQPVNMQHRFYLFFLLMFCHICL